MMVAQQKAAHELAQAATEEERKEKAAAMEQAQMFGMLNIMWTTTVVDITTTLHQVVQMVLHDQSVDLSIRKRRAGGLQERTKMSNCSNCATKWEPGPVHIRQDGPTEGSIASITKRSRIIQIPPTKHPRSSADQSNWSNISRDTLRQDYGRWR